MFYMFQGIKSILTPFLGHAVDGKFDTPHPPLCGDLSHKGRGFLTSQLTLVPQAMRENRIWITSPLVGEVARRAGEGALFNLSIQVLTRTQ